MNRKRWQRKFNGRDSRRWLKYNEPAYSAPRLEPLRFGHVLAAVRNFPENQRKHREAEAAASARKMGGRPVEAALTRQLLPGPEGRQWKAVDGALAAMKQMHHGNTAIKMIKHRYWGDAVMPSMNSTAKLLGISFGRALQLERTFFGLVALRMGYRPRPFERGVKLLPRGERYND